MRDLRSVRALAAVPFVLAALLTGCGGDDESSGEATSSSQEGGEAGDDTGAEPGELGAPEECAEAFPMAFGGADLAEVSLMPADWPEPVEDAVLCSASSDTDGAIQSAEFATALPQEEVVSSFEAALSGLEGYAVTASDSSDPDRASLTGTAGEVSFEVTAVPGGYTLVFAQG